MRLNVPVPQALFPRLSTPEEEMIKFIYAFADIISRPVSFAILTSLAFVGSAVALFTGKDIDAATIVNLAISVTTMIIGQAVLVSGRRDGLAFHLKLDRIIEALPSDNEAVGAERAKEGEIQREIEAVEQRAKAEPATQP